MLSAFPRQIGKRTMSWSVRFPVTHWFPGFMSSGNENNKSLMLPQKAAFSLMFHPFFMCSNTEDGKVFMSFSVFVCSSLGESCFSG
jgi:hypothetical protein